MPTLPKPPIMTSMLYKEPVNVDNANFVSFKLNKKCFTTKGITYFCIFANQNTNLLEIDIHYGADEKLDVYPNNLIHPSDDVDFKNDEYKLVINNRMKKLYDCIARAVDSDKYFVDFFEPYKLPDKELVEKVVEALEATEEVNSFTMLVRSLKD